MSLFLIITGMHRSGTSFLARALNLLGVNLGGYDSLTTHELKFNNDNLRGHWENKKILELAEKILESNNGTWDNIPKSMTISKEIGKEIKSCLAELVNTPALATGFKDPRILLYFDSWEKYLPKNFFVLGIFRHPLKVAESLKIRNQFSYEKSLELWKIYNEKLLQILEKHDGFLFDFDWSKKKLLDEIKIVAEKLGLEKNIDLKDWYAEELFHSDKTFKSNYNLPSEIIEIYNKLKQKSEQNKNLQISIHRKKEELAEIINSLLSQIRTNSNYYKQLFGEMPQKMNTLESQLKQATEIENELKENNSKIQSELSSLQSSLKDKESELSSLKSSLSDKESELSSLQSSLKDKESELSSLKSSLSDKESEITQLQSSLESTQQQILNIHQSFVFRMLHKYDKTLGKVLPLRPKKYLPSSKPQTEYNESPIIEKALTNIPLNKKDIICFPIINWDYRFQRPQHILEKFSEKGHRIFYLTVNLKSINKNYHIKELSNNIYQIELNSPKFFDILKDKFNESLVSNIILSIKEAKKDLKLDAISFVEFPTWSPLVIELKKELDFKIIFDCLDEYTGFSNVIKEREMEEKILLENSDFVTCSSLHLYEKNQKFTSNLLYLPNAGEFDHFNKTPSQILLQNYKKPIIGYFGSIADWFDNELIEYVAKKRPDYTFIFIGHTFGSDFCFNLL